MKILTYSTYRKQTTIADERVRVTQGLQQYRQAGTETKCWEFLRTHEKIGRTGALCLYYNYLTDRFSTNM
jgi:hypothetical protein